MDLADLLMTYGNWRGRFVPQWPRAVHISRELQAELVAGLGLQDAVETVLHEMRVGVDLTARLSRNVDVAYMPEAQRKTGGGLDFDVDAVLAHSGPQQAGHLNQSLGP